MANRARVATVPLRRLERGGARRERDGAAATLQLDPLALGRPVGTDGAVADVDELAASLRASSGDLGVFVPVLADKLERALPGRVRVERRRVKLLSSERRVARIECELGERRYDLVSVAPGRLEGRRCTVVRGVTLKTEPLALEAWIEALAADLAEEAEASEASAIAVQQLLAG